MIINVFPQKQLDFSAMYDFLKDLTDVEFDRGVKGFMQNTQVVNESTNVISIIREYAKPVTKITYV